MSGVEADIVRLAEIKQTIELLGSEKDTVEARIIDAIGTKPATVPVPWGGKVKATVIAAERVIINEDVLQKTLGAKLWGKVTKAVLDKAKLEAHITTGDIDANVVAACSETKVNKPYVKISGDTKSPQVNAAVEEFTSAKVAVVDSTGKAKPAAKKRVKKK